MPTSDINNPFGRLITLRDLEAKVTTALQTWVPTYVAEIERQGDLPARTIPLPPDENLSYRSGLDFNTWEQSWSPVFISRVSPSGEPERQQGSAPGYYLQAFRIDVALNFVVTNEVVSLAPAQGGLLEDSSRQYAGLLAMAGCAALLQHGSLGAWDDGSPVSLKTLMVQYPNTTFPYDNDRRVTRSTFSLLALVDLVVSDGSGLTSVPEFPYGDQPDLPSVENVNITLTSVSLDGSVD